MLRTLLSRPIPRIAHISPISTHLTRFGSRPMSSHANKSTALSTIEKSIRVERVKEGEFRGFPDPLFGNAHSSAHGGYLLAFAGGLLWKGGVGRGSSGWDRTIGTDVSRGLNHSFQWTPVRSHSQSRTRTFIKHVAAPMPPSVAPCLVSQPRPARPKDTVENNRLHFKTRPTIRFS